MDKLFDGIHRFCAKIIKNEKLLNLVCKVLSKEVILYLVFGVLTTVVNVIVYHIFNKAVDVLISNIIAWVAAVAFAYVTNKLFVFESKSWAPKVIAKEIPSFAGARLVTLGIEEAGLIIMIKWLALDSALTIYSGGEKLIGGEMVVKILLSVIVIILNYIFSKLIIFKKK